MNKPITWFEIPALDLNRARAFYETIFGITMIPHDMPPMQLAVFPYDREHSTGGCIQTGPGNAVSKDGTVIYLNAGSSLDAVLAKVVAAGGAILLPKTALPPGMGHFAHIQDTEGNRVGVHGVS